MPVPLDRVKLTLRLDRRTVAAVRRYARVRGTSVGTLVADYLRSLAAREEPPPSTDDGWKTDLPPITRQLVGLARGADLDEEDYYRYLDEKHR